MKKRKEIDWEKVGKHLNKPVICKFWDHAMGDEPVLCNVVGFLAKNEKEHVMIVAWDCPSLNQVDRLHNMEYFSILKGVILDIIPLRKSRVWG